MNVIKIRNDLRKSAEFNFPACDRLKIPCFINCKTARVSSEGFLNTTLAKYLTRSKKAKYTKINYIVKFCENCVPGFENNCEGYEHVG